MSVKFKSQIGLENIKKPLDGAYLADIGIDIRSILTDKCELEHLYQREIHPSELCCALLGPGDDDGHKTGAVITVDTRVLNDGAQSDNQNALD